MYLFFDTETTGKCLSRYARPSDLQHWPRLVQLAWVLAEDDGREICAQSDLVQPAGWTIPEEAVKVHGITTEVAYEDGEDILTVLGRFRAPFHMAHGVVAHNYWFDAGVVGSEYHRIPAPDPLEDRPNLCTMLTSVPVCRLPGNYGDFKWPSLAELHSHLFGTGFGGAHDALTDVRATARCFFRLRELGIIRPPLAAVQSGGTL